MPDDEEEKPKSGIVLQPWLVTLMLGFIMNLIGFAFTWGTVVTRIDALDARVQRIERQLDEDRRLRSPANYVSPPVKIHPGGIVLIEKGAAE